MKKSIKINTSLFLKSQIIYLWDNLSTFVSHAILALFRRNRFNISTMLVSVLLSLASLAIFALIFVGAYFGHKKLKQTIQDEIDRRKELEKMNKDNTPDKKVEAEFEKNQQTQPDQNNIKLGEEQNQDQKQIHTDISNKNQDDNKSINQTITSKHEDDEENNPFSPTKEEENKMKNPIEENNRDINKQSNTPQTASNTPIMPQMLNLNNINQNTQQQLQNTQTPQMSPIASNAPFQQQMPFMPPMQNQNITPQIPPITPQMPTMPFPTQQPAQFPPMMQQMPTINAKKNDNPTNNLEAKTPSFVDKLNQQKGKDLMTNLQTINKAKQGEKLASLNK